jgi:hypothetical protein
MPDIAGTDSYEILREDRGSACPIIRAPGSVHPWQAGRCGDPAVTLAAPGSGALRELIRGHHAGRPVTWEVAP